MLLILITLLFSLVCVPWVAYLQRSWVNPCSWYWAGWMLGAIGVKLAADVDLGPAISQYGFNLILVAHVGALIGFVVSALVARIFAPSEKPAENLTVIPSYFWGWAALAVVAQVIFGVALLAQVIHSGGGLLGSFYDIRQNFLETRYLTDEPPALFRLFGIATCCAQLMPVLLAIRDSRERTIRFVPLTITFLAGVPGGVSTGGRVWLATVISVYMVAYVLAADGRHALGQAWSGAKRLFIPIAALLTLFAVIGTMRESANPSGGAFENYGKDRFDRAFYPIYGYLGVPVIAVGPYSQFAEEETRPTMGMMTFSWLGEQAGKLKMADSDRLLQEIIDGRGWVLRNDDIRLASTHATILPSLILDFGRPNLLLAVCLYMGGLSLLWSLLRRRGIAGFTVAVVICLYGAFASFQDVLFGSSSGLLPLAYVCGITLLRSVLKPLLGASKVWATALMRGS